MQQNSVFVVTITNTDGTQFDLSDILRTIGLDIVRSLTWKVHQLDCTGLDVQPFCDDVNNAHKAGIWVSGEQLLEVIERCGQVIEGLFIGYPTEEAPLNSVAPYTALRQFLHSKALIAIEVIDGYHYDIYIRDVNVVECLEQSFENASRKDPLRYLLEGV